MARFSKRFKLRWLVTFSGLSLNVIDLEDESIRIDSFYVGHVDICELPTGKTMARLYMFMHRDEKKIYKGLTDEACDVLIGYIKKAILKKKRLEARNEAAEKEEINQRLKNLSEKIAPQTMRDVDLDLVQNIMREGNDGG